MLCLSVYLNDEVVEGQRQVEHDAKYLQSTLDIRQHKWRTVDLACADLA